MCGSLILLLLDLLESGFEMCVRVCVRSCVSLFRTSFVIYLARPACLSGRLYVLPMFFFL